jgi:ribosomal protein S18 acetylase RimI-like enzyme
MPDSIRIAIAEPKDVRDMQEVFYRTWLATYPNREHGVTTDDIEFHFKDAFTDETLAARAEKIAHPAKGSTLLLAKEGERVVGLCRTVVSDAENRLQAMYILPEYQGQGIGRMLWGEALKIFTPDRNILVEVAEYNAKAISFYGKLGFVDTGRRWADEKFRMKSGSIIPDMEMIIRR